MWIGTCWLRQTKCKTYLLTVPLIYIDKFQIYQLFVEICVSKFHRLAPTIHLLEAVVCIAWILYHTRSQLNNNDFSSFTISLLLFMARFPKMTVLWDINISLFQLFCQFAFLISAVFLVIKNILLYNTGISFKKPKGILAAAILLHSS